MTKPQQRGAGTETEKGETSSPAPALHVLCGRGRSITMHIWHSQPFHGVTCGRGRSITMHIWHSQPFHGVTCVLLAGGCNLTGPRNIVAEISPLDLYAHRAWFRTSTRQKRALSERMPDVDQQGGADCRSKGIFLPMGDHGILGSLRRAFSPL